MADKFTISTCLSAEFPNVDFRQDVLIPTPLLNFPYNERNFCKEADPLNPYVCLSWHDVPGAEVYLLQLSYNPQFNGPSVREFIINDPTNFYCLDYFSDFKTQQQIYWRVLAANLTTGGVSNPSEVRQFSFDCDQEGTQNPTPCDEFNINIELIGSDSIPCCGKAEYMIHFTADCIDDPTHPDYFQIKNGNQVYYELKYNGNTLSTQPGDNNADDFAALRSVEDNLYKICLDTGFTESQYIQLCAAIIFEFPNSSRQDFSCNGCKQIWADCKDDRRNTLAIPEEYIDLSDNDFKKEQGPALQADAEYHLRGPVYLRENPCTEEWYCDDLDCDCEMGKVATTIVDGIRNPYSVEYKVLEIGDIVTFDMDCGGYLEAELLDVNYEDDCNCFTSIFRIRWFCEDGSLAKEEVEEVRLPCTCPTESTSQLLITNDIGAIFALASTTNILAIDSAMRIPLKCDGAECDSLVYANITVTNYTVLGCSEIEVDISVVFICSTSGALIDTDSATLHFTNYTPFFGRYSDIGAEGSFVEYHYSGVCGDHTFSLGYYSKDSGQDCSPVESIRDSCPTDSFPSGVPLFSLIPSLGKYQPDSANQAPCPCIPEELDVEFEVGGQTGFARFKREDGEYVEVSQNPATTSLGTYSILEIRIEDCDMLIIMSEPSVEVATVVVETCEPFVGSVEYEFSSTEETANFTVFTSYDCGPKRKPLEARVNIPLGCHLKVEEEVIEVDVDALVDRGFPEGRETYLRAKQGNNCKVISPRVCKKIPIDTDLSEFSGQPMESIELLSNSVHVVEIQQQIFPGNSGPVRIVYRFTETDETFVSEEFNAFNGTSVALSEGEATVIVSQDCTVNLITGPSRRLDSAISNIEDLSGTQGNGVDVNGTFEPVLTPPDSGCGSRQCKYVANSDLVWEIEFNHCSSNTTTTPDPSTSTTTTTTTEEPEFCGTTTTTPDPESPCICNPPSYCPNYEGECVVIDCSKKYLDYNTDCVDTTTTTGDPTSTTTPCPDCSTRTCTGYRAPNNRIYVLESDCPVLTGPYIVNLADPADSQGVTNCFCDPTNFSFAGVCTSNTVPCVEPIVNIAPCEYDCEFIYSAVLGEWFLTDRRCSRTYNCNCSPPNFAGEECEIQYTPCYSVSTTTIDPCVSTTTTSTTPHPDCDNLCKFYPNVDLDGWIKSNKPEHSCKNNCPCLEPATLPKDECDVRFSKCSEDNVTTTTENPDTLCCRYQFYEYISCGYYGEGSCTGLDANGSGYIPIDSDTCDDCPRYGACCTEVSAGNFECEDNVLQEDCVGENKTFSDAQNCQGLADSGRCGISKICCVYDIEPTTGGYLFSGCDRLSDGDETGCTDSPSIHTVLLEPTEPSETNYCDECPEYGSCCSEGSCTDNVTREDCSRLIDYFYPYSLGTTRDCAYFESTYPGTCDSTTTTTTTTPAPEGACCSYTIEGTFIGCTDEIEADCIGVNIYWLSGEDCSTNPCPFVTTTTTTTTTPAPVGACCYGSATCVETTEADCISTYSGYDWVSGQSCGGGYICPAPPP